jgi:hypothetical protein
VGDPEAMGIREDINRDYPYQVALPLDDKLVGVLDWLDERLGRVRLDVFVLGFIVPCVVEPGEGDELYAFQGVGPFKTHSVFSRNVLLHHLTV